MPPLPPPVPPHISPPPPPRWRPTNRRPWCARARAAGAAADCRPPAPGVADSRRRAPRARAALSHARAAPRPPQEQQDLHTAALLCEAAYRTHFSRAELLRHVEGVRRLLEAAHVEGLSVHAAGDQR
jgi:hypothetical protein